MPGLLQTEDYAAEIVRHSPYTQLPDEARAAELRRARQVRLNGDDPVHLDAVIDEGALRRVVGGPEVMSAQLPRLAERMTDSDYLEGLRDVAAYRHAHEQLRAKAIPPEESREMISGLAKELMR